MATMTTIAPEYVLADVLAVIGSKAAEAGADASLLVGEAACQYHLGRLSMARELAVFIEARLATLTAVDA